MNCIQKQQLVSFPKVRIWKPWFRHFNNHKEFRNEGTVHLFSLMALFSYANFRSNERMISGERYMEAPGQWICKLGSLPRILRVHSKRQALEQLDYYEKYGFLTYEWLDEENEIIRFSITNWKEHCTSLQYNYYSYKGSGFFFFPLPVGRMLLRIAHKTEGIVFSELDAIMDMWLHTILNDPKVRGSEYMPVVYYSNMRGVPLLSYTYLAKRWGWSKSRVGRFMLKAGEYGIISRVSFSSSRGSVISMCRYWHSFMNFNGDSGARSDRFSIRDNVFFQMPIPIPDIDEQRKIGELLTCLDNLITLHQRQPFLQSPPDISLIVQLTPPFYTFSWEQRKFDEVFDCTVPNNTLSRAELSYDEGTVLNVHYGDVLIKYGSVLDVQKDDIPRIPHRCREDFNGALLQDGDVIIADTAEDETTGKACEIGNLQGSAIVSGLHTMVCRPRNRMALGYLGYYLNSNAYHHQLLPLMQGIKVLSLSRSNIQKTSVSYPIAVKEQQLIAYYFSQLDNLITLHQRQTIVYAVIRSIRKVILAERQYFAPPMVRKSP